MGPVLIFDKSTLQSLSVDESVWLENFFHSNITPIFFVETLADLSKRKAARRGETMVAEIARKTPNMSSFPNAFHLDLVANDLVGNHPPMTSQVILAGGTSKRSPEGKVGTHYEEFDEAAAMARWQQGQFHEIERALAGVWRSSLTGIDFRSMMTWALTTLKIDRVATLDEAKIRADEYASTGGMSVVQFAGRFLGVAEAWEDEYMRRYAQAGNALLSEFAPYASYVLRVNLFFYVAMASHLIARERPSNMMDIAYLYYLPFCQAFASNDKLHARTAPLFCERGQQCVGGKQLKAGLREVNDYYLRYSDEIEKVGIMRFARYPPDQLDNTVTQLWDRYMRGWREANPLVEESDLDRGSDNRMSAERLVDIVEKSVSVPSTADSEYVMIRRKAPVRKGRWRLMPPEVETSGSSIRENMKPRPPRSLD